jgi:conjugative transposon TraM protein
METQTVSTQFLKKRKLFLMLPLLVLPFVTLLFWALGGGKGSDLQAQQQNPKRGLNTDLPNAYLKDEKPLDKLSYYEKASSDSAKLENLMKNDPYYMQFKSMESKDLLSSNDSLNSAKNNHKGIGDNIPPNPEAKHNQLYSDPNEAKVYKKLDELNAALNSASTPVRKVETYSSTVNNHPTINSSDVDRLEKMMEMNKGSEDDENPEIKQLNGMMDKILAIQHPERIKEELKKKSEAHEGQVFAVTANNQNPVISLLTGDSASQRQPSAKNKFFTLKEDMEYPTDQNRSIKATIYETQTLVDGSIVKFRLLNDIYINGTNIPKNNFVFGLATLNGERLNIVINSIRFENAIFPVNLSVFDMDGIDGIYIPGASTRDVAKQSADRALQGIGLTTLDPSIGAQAASAGIEAAKSLMSRKVKLIKVTIKAGYQVLLLDEKQKTSS